MLASITREAHKPLLAPQSQVVIFCAVISFGRTRVLHGVRVRMQDLCVEEHGRQSPGMMLTDAKASATEKCVGPPGQITDHREVSPRLPRLAHAAPSAASPTFRFAPLASAFWSTPSPFGVTSTEDAMAWETF